MVESRKHFHDELDRLEATIQEMGAASARQLRQAIDALIEDDPDLCDAVIAGDDVIDAHYILVERGVVELFALQGPVAMDLRLLATLMHVNLHLERISDMAVNIAKITRAAAGLPRMAGVLDKLQEMGSIALAMLAASLDAFARRDLSLARALPAMDDPLDELNRGMVTEVLSSSKDKRALEWGMQMHVVSRQIERVGDHAVDIAEQAAYLVTGVFQEFTDASHPEIEAGNRLTEAGI